MEKKEIRGLRERYVKELKENILPFWVNKSPDYENGGFVNCFNNIGTELVSGDKYTWSQGRFLWMWSKLVTTKSDIFSDEQRTDYLKFAGMSAKYIQDNCFMPDKPLRCKFLTDQSGQAKLADKCDYYDSSIYADMFVSAGFAKYSLVSNNKDDFRIALELYLSIEKRLKDNNYRTLPYPLSSCYRAHGIPMIFLNLSVEVYQAAKKYDLQNLDSIKSNIIKCSDMIQIGFLDENHVIHEIVRSDYSFFGGTLGRHANPGHTLECMWFIMEADGITGRKDGVEDIAKIALKAFDIGWDEQYGGLYQYSSVDGGPPEITIENATKEYVEKQVIGDWEYKLWWVHSEALYTSLLLYFVTEDEKFLEWHYRTAEYVRTHFPNPNREVGEWIQILSRDGTPEEKVVALPVKDPYHITRDLILIIELLDAHLNTY